jgi:excisionase family DNA binding protein
MGLIEEAMPHGNMTRHNDQVAIVPGQPLRCQGGRAASKHCPPCRRDRPRAVSTRSTSDRTAILMRYSTQQANPESTRSLPPNARTGRPNGAPKPLISVEQAAELLGQSRSSVYRAIAKGELPLPLLRIGGRYRIPRISVERLVDGQMTSNRSVESTSEGSEPDT